MKLKNKIVGGLLKMKNRQLRAEREKSRALDETNSILSAYVASLIEERGGARIAKDQIRSAIGKYSAQVIADRIAERALKEKGVSSDDITVAVMLIEEAY